MRLTNNTDNDGALLDCLASILDLEYSALGRARSGRVSGALYHGGMVGEITNNVTESLS